MKYAKHFLKSVRNILRNSLGFVTIVFGIVAGVVSAFSINILGILRGGSLTHDNDQISESLSYLQVPRARADATGDTGGDSGSCGCGCMDGGGDGGGSCAGDGSCGGGGCGGGK